MTRRSCSEIQEAQNLKSIDTSESSSILSDSYIEHSSVEDPSLLKSQKFPLMATEIERIFGAYQISQQTLFSSIGLAVRFLKEADLQNMEFRTNNIDHIKLQALVIFNLASKYNERISFKVSDLAQRANINLDFLFKESQYKSLNQALQMQEFEVLKVLQFRIGGDPTPLEFIQKYLKSTLSQDLAVKTEAHTLYPNSLKLAYQLIKNPISAFRFSPEEISLSAIFVSMKLCELHRVESSS